MGEGQGEGERKMPLVLSVAAKRRSRRIVSTSSFQVLAALLCYWCFILFLLSDSYVYAESLSSPPSHWGEKVLDRSISGLTGLSESVWTLSRPPHEQYDTIALHRITKTGSTADAPRPVFLFFPGAHLHGEVVIGDERYDLRLYLANRGIETWTLDYRTHTLPREQIRDSRFMQPWTTEAFIEDAAVAADFVRKTSGRQSLFVGGFGRGATFAALMSGRYGRGDIHGLILLDGYVLDPPAEIASSRCFSQ